MNFGLIVVGDEILSGKRTDKHFPKVVELLAERGLVLSWVRYVGDGPPYLTPALRDALASGDVVFCCGGIGATPDDHTRQSAAEALGVPLALHPHAEALVQQRMREMAAERGIAFDPDHPENRRRLAMAELPSGAALIANPYNRIPGFSLGHVHFVPGFPVMAHPMIASVLDERYAHLRQSQGPIERSVIVMGAMESALIPLMKQIEDRFVGVKIFSLPSLDHPRFGRHIELGVKGRGAAVEAAFIALREGLSQLGASLGPEMVRGSGQ